MGVCSQFLKGLGMPIEEFMPKEPPPPPEPSAAKPVEKKGMLARLTKARKGRQRPPQPRCHCLPITLARVRLD
jgi:hypothetical protein